MTKRYLGVSIYQMDQGFVVLGWSRGPAFERVGEFHPTEDAAREAAKSVPVRRPQRFIGLVDGRVLS